MKIIRISILLSLFVFTGNSTFAQLQWVKYTGEVPENAVIGGVENHIELPVCRGNFNGAMHPGKLFANHCNIGYGGVEKMLKDFEVLVNDGVIELDWLKSNGTLPEHAVQAGTEGGIGLYVGRAHHEKSTHPGKVFKVGGNYICNIGYGTLEVVNETFEVLVENPADEEAIHTNHDNRCAAPDEYLESIVGFVGMMPKEKQINEGFSLVSNNLKYVPE